MIRALGVFSTASLMHSPKRWQTLPEAWSPNQTTRLDIKHWKTLDDGADLGLSGGLVVVGVAHLDRVLDTKITFARSGRTFPVPSRSGSLARYRRARFHSLGQHV